MVKEAFVDTSVLLGGLIDLGVTSKSSQALLDAIAAGRIKKPRTAWHCCLEFYAVATRLPEEFRLTPADALALLEGEVSCGDKSLATAREGIVAHGHDVRGRTPRTEPPSRGLQASTRRSSNAWTLA